MKKPAFNVVLTIGVSSAAALSASAQPRYTVTHLGNLPAGSTVYAQGLNNRGQIVGAVGYGVIVSKAFIWQRGVISEAPGSIGGPFVQAFAINESGMIVGEATDALSNINPVLWVNGQMQALPLLGGTTGSARAINDSGVAVGYSRLAGDTVYHAVRWMDGVAEDMGAIIGPAGSSQANAVTERGGAVGFSQVADGRSEPVLWERDTTLLPLATLEVESAQAMAVNASQVIVGTIKMPGQEDRAALFGSEAQYAMLGELSGDFSSRPLGLNNAHVVVGFSKRNTTTMNAVMWDLAHNPAPVNLNTRIPAGSPWQLQCATAINDRGWIIGWGTYYGQRRSFLLRPSCTADIATAGSVDPDAGPDGFVTGEDFDMFIQAFFNEERNRFGILLADVATAGTGQAYPDDMVTGEDFDLFVQAFFNGCG